jgi:hypothetical protein
MLAFICGVSFAAFIYGWLLANFAEDFLPTKDTQNAMRIVAGGSIIFGFIGFTLSVVIAVFA